MWWDAEELLGSANYKRGAREERDPGRRSRGRNRREALGGLHASANQVLISARVLETEEVSYFWKACLFSAWLGSNAASYMSGNVLDSLKGRPPQFWKKVGIVKIWGEKKNYSILLQNMFKIHLTSWQSSRWQWLFALPYGKVLSPKFVSAFFFFFFFTELCTIKGGEINK